MMARNVERKVYRQILIPVLSPRMALPPRPKKAKWAKRSKMGSGVFWSNIDVRSAIPTCPVQFPSNLDDSFWDGPLVKCISKPGTDS